MTMINEKDKNTQIAVLGGGSFGCVLANIMAENGNAVTLWMRDADRVDEVNVSHTNSRYLPQFQLSHTIKATTDIRQAVVSADTVFIAIPSHSFRDVLQRIKPYVHAEHILVSTTKGIESKTFNMMSIIIQEEVPHARVGVLSGPNLAKEIARKQLSASVIASSDTDLRERVQSLLHCPYFRVYASSDVYGVELGGTLKNIYAIAAGMSAALGMGENTKSMLLTRALAEMSRFAVSLGANPLTFLGLAGVGDLIVTCMSPLSRNYRVGFALGQGKGLQEAIDELGEVAEGVNTLKQVYEQSKLLGIYMPLVDGLYKVVFKGESVGEVAREMMMNVQSSDVEFVLPRREPNA